MSNVIKKNAKVREYSLCQDREISNAASNLMRRLCAARDNDTDFTVCKVDMHNAFNSACRQAMLDALVNRGLPELVPWMSWLMKNTSETLSMLAERFGVDPALLRSANVGVPLPEADDVDVSQSVHSIIVPSGAKGDVATIGLEGNLWYLDDGILCGPSSAVLRAFEHFQARAALGLRINLKKCELLVFSQAGEQKARRKALGPFPEFHDEFPHAFTR